MNQAVQALINKWNSSSIGGYSKGSFEHDLSELLSSGRAQAEDIPKIIPSCDSNLRGFQIRISGSSVTLHPY